MVRLLPVCGLTLPSLDEFAAARKPVGKTAFWWSLPDEIREEIITSGAASETVVLWLHELGWTDASFGKVDPYRRKAKHERQADAG